ncbi:MAG TPA: polyprenol phosphomannose-dependent alpha 1,6 mannosyltransferase MptB [Acidimicrobiales bacterium]|nr:polyprenol phosphomannose-dependent alpha 1,6 mannosyltransferase MptB [Acidimicrobiales bacterium]
MADNLTSTDTDRAPNAGRLATIGRRVADRVEVLGDAAAMRLEVAKVRLLPPAFLAGRVRPDADDADDWTFLRRPALLGFLALAAVAVGASMPSSPFKLEMAGTWFFGEPAADTTSTSFMLFGLVAVYGGLVLFARVWYGLMKALARRPGVPVRHLGWILALWLVPMLVVAPIFSRDVFSYAAQGEMMSHHINPYHYGPFTLGAGPYVNPVDPLWGNTPAPYGPLFLMVDGFLASVSFHHATATVVLLRLFSLAGVALIAWCIPKLARAYGRDPGPVYVMAVLNPLVLLTLVGAAHNDAVMIGLLLAGVTAAKYKHPVWGVVLCALAAAIKVPAALGIVYVGWEWMGTGVPWRQRVRPVVAAGLVAGAVMLALSTVSGLGLGWIGNLATPGTVRSWLAPATGIGMGVGGLLHAVGLQGVSTAGVLSVTRVLGLLGAAVASVYLLVNSDRIGGLKSLGLSLLLFVVLGPVVQPWYLTWGVILLAPVATGRLRTLLIALSVVSPFIGLPGGRTLLNELIHANPLAVAAALLVLLGVLLAPIGRWATAWRDAGDDLVPEADWPDDPVLPAF